MKNVLVVSPNWLGDAVMALPALRRLLRENDRRQRRISILSRPALAPFWRCVEGVGEVLELPKTNAATFGAGRRLRERGFAEALLLPNSFRSALVAWLAGIPRRRGTAGQARRILLTDPVRFDERERSLHQAFEYAKILCGSAECDLADSGYRPGPPDPALAAAVGVGAPGPLVGIVPGAARGPSKRWPHFAAAARLLRESVPDVHFAVFGGRGEEDTCGALAAEIAAPDLCARTTLPQFASLLAACSCVLCNDSGGMHLAAAAGAPVVAVFGLTDPEKTGPVGPRARVRVVRAEGVRPSRAIARNDPAALRALASVAPERVVAAALECLDRR